jgi:hypothetical protein
LIGCNSIHKIAQKLHQQECYYIVSRLLFVLVAPPPLSIGAPPPMLMRAHRVCSSYFIINSSM